MGDTEQQSLYRWLREQTLSRSREERRRALLLRSDLARKWPAQSNSDRAAIEALVQVMLEMRRLDMIEIDALTKASGGEWSAFRAIPKLSGKREALLREHADLMGLLARGTLPRR